MIDEDRYLDECDRAQRQVALERRARILDALYEVRMSDVTNRALRTLCDACGVTFTDVMSYKPEGK